MNLSKEREEEIIEQNTKELIKTMIYYGASTQKENIEYVIRQFYYLIKKEYCDKMIAPFPAEHPIKEVYQNVTNICFTQSILSAFAKMSMWQIKKKVSNWELIDSKEAVTAFAEEINKMDVNDIKHFIEENEKIMEEEPNKYNYLFMILYRVDAYIHKNEIEDYKNNIIKRINLIENYELDIIVNREYAIKEKSMYIKNLFDELIKIAKMEKDYENEKKYCKWYKKIIKEGENYGN